MLALRRHTALGQYQYPMSPTASIDPMVHAGLQATAVVLSSSDPGINDTVGYIERIIAAPPLFGSSTGGITVPVKVSDINPYLAVAANVQEHKLATLLGIVSIPVVFFLLGKASARRKAHGSV